MDRLAGLLNLAGTWEGSNRLWLRPTESPNESQSTAQVAPAAGGKFVQISYTWAFDGAPQQGLLLCGYEAADEAATVAWIDSFHMGDKLLLSRGKVNTDGALDVHGSYVVDDSPEWGWRTVITAGGETLRVMMYNISPEGEEYPAVEMVWGRN